MGGGVLTGTAALARLVLRRDRVRLAAWFTVLAVLPPVTAVSFAELFPGEAARAGYAAGVAMNPSIVALQGPVFGTTLGAITVARTLTFSATLAALFCVLTVVRHTRAEEETGRRELLGSTAVGRHAGLAAALAVVAAFDVLLAAAIAAGMVAVGLPVAGSVAAGLAVAGAGLVFTGVAGVTAQLTEGARAATGIALVVLAAAFAARASGDVAGSWPGWASPLGWPARVRAFADERWWVLVLPLAVTLVLVGVAFVLSAHRDLAAGLFPARPGPPAAGPRLRGPAALAARLQRPALIGWTAGFAIGGAVFGGVARGVGDLLDGSPQLTEIVGRLGGGADPVEVFLAAEFGILGMVAAAYAVSAALRLHAEENAGRAEPVLATGVGRVPWAAGHVGFALLGPAVLLGAAGVTSGLVHGAAIGDVAGQVPRLTAGALAQLPGAWVLAGIAVAAFGLAPRRVSLAWAALAAFLLLGQFGQLLGLDPLLLDLSPFTHLPRALGEVDLQALGVLTGIAAALTAAGLAGLRRRDIAS